MMSTRNTNREGFSLIEMIIAIAIVGIVMSGVILLISYSTNNMRRTSNSVSLQNQTKDAILHMTTYIQEGSEAEWYDQDGKKVLMVAKRVKNSEGSTDSLEVSHYWLKPEADADASDDKGLVFAKDVVGFHCEVRDNRYLAEVTAAPGATVTPGGGAATPTPSATETPDPAATPDNGRYVICYCKRIYNGTDVNDHLTADGKVNFASLVLDYGSVTSSDEVTVSTPGPGGGAATPAPTAPAGGGSAVVPTPEATPTPAATAPALSTAVPTMAPKVINAGGSYVVITIEMENETGDAKFTSQKEVFLRNQ